MKRTFFLLLCPFLLGMIACSNELDYDQMAQEICTCTKPMLELNLKVESYLETGEIEKATEMVDEIETAADTQANCMEKIEEKYGIIEGEEAEQLAVEALERNCPEIAALMQELEAE